MTRDGIIQDVGETKRRLMSGEFTPKQAEALIGFVNEQIKEYCHSKVDQRVFEKRLDEKLQTFHTKEDQRIFEQKLEKKLDDRFLQIMEMIKTQSLAINELTKKVDKISEKHSLF